MQRLFSFRNPKPEKTCAITRYGAIGDVIQVSSILPHLAGEGYHITMYVTPVGELVLRHNPYINAFVVQNSDDVPNYQLGDFWAYTSKKYDRWINLSESIERTLLAMPLSMVHGWPQKARHEFLNKNYLSMLHMIADVPYEPRPMFHPTKAEDDWAQSERKKFGDDDVVLMSLSGSAVHKYWPNLDEGIRYLTEMGLEVVTAGDEMCKKQEEGFETNSRVHCRSGQWSLRESLAFANYCDLVIGSETGLLNAVSHQAHIAKIVMLSHSSHENLTRDWANTIAIEPADTPCYPCHRMHFGFDHCTKGVVNGETVGALCQLNISASDVAGAAVELLNSRGADNVA